MAKQMHVPIHKRIIVYLWTQSHSDHKVTVKELSEMLEKEGFTCDIVRPQDIIKAAMRRRDIIIEGAKLSDPVLPDDAIVTLRTTQND